MLDATAETSNRIVAIIGERRFVYNVAQRHRSGVSSLHVLDEVDNVVQSGIAFSPFSSFYKEFNEQIGRMVSGGFFKFWLYYHSKQKAWKARAEEIPPQVLTMEHMEVAFIASLLPFTFAVSAFMVEMMALWTKVFIPKLSTFFVVKAFYKLHRTSDV